MTSVAATRSTSARRSASSPRSRSVSRARSSRCAPSTSVVRRRAVRSSSLRLETRFGGCALRERRDGQEEQRRGRGDEPPRRREAHRRDRSRARALQPHLRCASQGRGERQEVEARNADQRVGPLRDSDSHRGEPGYGRLRATSSKASRWRPAPTRSPVFQQRVVIPRAIPAHVRASRSCRATAKP